MLEDPHFQAGGLFENVPLDGDTVKLPAFAPKLSETPGGTEWIGPPLGAHNQQIFCEMLGISEREMRALTAEGVI